MTHDKQSTMHSFESIVLDIDLDKQTTTATNLLFQRLSSMKRDSEIHSSITRKSTLKCSLDEKQRASLQHIGTGRSFLGYSLANVQLRHKHSPLAKFHLLQRLPSSASFLVLLERVINTLAIQMCNVKIKTITLEAVPQEFVAGNLFKIRAYRHKNMSYNNARLFLQKFGITI